MDMHGEVTVVVVEQMLAVRLGVPQNAPVDQRGARREPALRAAHREPPPGEELPMQRGKPMNGVSLWHAATVINRPRAPAADR